MNKPETDNNQPPETDSRTVKGRVQRLVGIRQYYYRVTACRAHSAQSPSCLCWHDEGTGPMAGASDGDIKEWREKPNKEIGDA